MLPDFTCCQIVNLIGSFFGCIDASLQQLSASPTSLQQLTATQSLQQLPAGRSMQQLTASQSLQQLTAIQLTASQISPQFTEADSLQQLTASQSMEQSLDGIVECLGRSRGVKIK